MCILVAVLHFSVLMYTRWLPFINLIIILLLVHGSDTKSQIPFNSSNKNRYTRSNDFLIAGFLMQRQRQFLSNPSNKNTLKNMIRINKAAHCSCESGRLTLIRWPCTGPSAPAVSNNGDGNGNDYGNVIVCYRVVLYSPRTFRTFSVPWVSTKLSSHLPIHQG